jgi:hypothetical protein
MWNLRAWQDPGGGGKAYNGWMTAWSKVSTSIVTEIWRK